jgi:hypothetical protein
MGVTTLKIHAIQTGTVRVKVCQRVGRGRGSLRQVNILLDPSWTEALPIYAWAVETPEGIVLVDTGETARTGEPGYFPRWHPYFRLAVRLDVTPEQEVGPQLLKLGIRPGDVRTVILTHLHTESSCLTRSWRLREGSLGSFGVTCRTDGRSGSLPGRSSSSRKPWDPSIEVTMSPLTARSSSCRPQDTLRGTSRWLSWMTMSTTSWRAMRHTRNDP